MSFPIREKRTRSQPVCFHHIPKCAGSSIHRVLRKLQNTWNLLDSYDEYSGTFLTPEEVQRLHSQGWWFTFVRNPFGRVVSAWQMFEQAPAYNVPAVGGRTRTLADVVSLIVDIDWSTWRRKYDGQRFPASEFGTDDYLIGHLTPCYCHPLNQMHFIGQVENMQDDWAVVQDATGIRVALPRINTTNHRPYRDYFTPELRDKVAAIYRDDIERFDYTF